MSVTRRCELTYVSGVWRGGPCRYRATNIVVVPHDRPFLACGYHVRGYTPNAIYPLDWSLATIRRFRLSNLAALEASR